MIVVRQGDAHAAAVAIGVLGELGVAAVEGPPLLGGLEQVVGREVYTHLSRSTPETVDDGGCLLDENLLGAVDGVGEMVVLA